MRSNVRLAVVLVAAFFLGPPFNLRAQVVSSADESPRAAGALTDQGRRAIESTTARAPESPLLAQPPRTKRDSLWNGILIGAAVGMVAGVVLVGTEISSQEPGLASAATAGPAALYGTVVGAVAGAAIGGVCDAMRHDRTPDPTTPQGRQRPPTPGWRASVAIPVRF